MPKPIVVYDPIANELLTPAVAADSVSITEAVTVDKDLTVIGSTSIVGLVVFSNSVTIGGITRNTWPAAGNATQALSSVLANGSTGNIPLAGKFQIKNSTGITTYLDIDEVTGIASVSNNAGGISKILSAVDKDVALGVAGLDANLKVIRNPASLETASGVAGLNANLKVIRNPASLETASGVAGLDANLKVIRNPASLETASGVAGLDANLEVIKPQAGAAAQVALGHHAANRRADGAWSSSEILAACTFSVAAGVLTIHKMHGFATFTRSSVGTFPFTFTTPAPDASWHDLVQKVNNLSNVSAYAYTTLRSVNGGTLDTFEANVLADPAGSGYPSSIVIFR